MQRTDTSSFLCQPDGWGCLLCLVTPSFNYIAAILLQPSLMLRCFILSLALVFLCQIFHDVHFTCIFSSCPFFKKIPKAHKDSWHVTHPWIWPWNSEIFLIYSMIMKQRYELSKKKKLKQHPSWQYVYSWRCHNLPSFSPVLPLCSVIVSKAESDFFHTGLPDLSCSPSCRYFLSPLCPGSWLFSHARACLSGRIHILM